MASTTLPPIAPRAEAGAHLLDNLQPTWHRYIAPDQLDLSNARGCILGQLYGDYGSGVDDLHQLISQSNELNGTDDELDEAACGFILFVDDPDIAYAKLTAAWHAQIAARQTGGER